MPMPLEGGLTIEFPDGREPVRLRFRVDAADELILKAFSAANRALLAALQRAGGLPARLRIAWRQGEGLRFEVEEPSDDQRAVILHQLRPIILNNEPGSFNRACAAVRRASDHEFLGQHLRRLRDIYDGVDMRDVFVISRGEMVLNSEAAFQHWLNGFEYHREGERAAQIADADALLPLEAVRPIFMGLLAEKLKAITLLGYLIDRLLERPVVAPEPG